LISYTYSINDYEFDLYPSTFPNNGDIRHSALAGFNYDILDNLKISVGGIWRNGQPYTSRLKAMKPSKVVANTMVNYGALTARIWMTCVWMLPFSYSFNFSPAIKATLRGGVINITDEDNVINRYYK
jgi:hypothetical protein